MVNVALWEGKWFIIGHDSLALNLLVAFLLLVILDMIHEHSLPTEILWDIFQLFLAPSATTLEESFDDAEELPISGTAFLYPSFKVFDARDGPWLLTHVCRQWREIALSSPSLWRSFYLDTPPKSERGAVRMLKTCLDRSARLPLVFSVKADRIYRHTDSQELLQLLNHESDRWFIIQVINPSFKFWHRLAGSEIIQPLSSLKEISFMSTSFDEPDDSPSAMVVPWSVHDIFAQGQTPVLDTIINHEHLTLSKFNIPWTQISVYDGAVSISPKEHFRVLHCAPNLIRCSLAFESDEYDNVVSHGKPLLLPVLQKLRTEFLFYSEDNICPALQDIVVPSLEELSIIGRGSHSSPPFEVFASILRTSSCSLQYLELSGILSDRLGAIRDLLEASAAIIHLRVWINSPVHQAVIPLLNARNFPHLVPRLQCLDLAQKDTRDVWELDMLDLADTVRSRLESNRPEGSLCETVALHTVRFALQTYCFVELPKGVPPIIEVLQGEGLHIAVCRSIDPWRM